jgi:hypothetical protein
MPMSQSIMDTEWLHGGFELQTDVLADGTTQHFGHMEIYRQCIFMAV